MRLHTATIRAVQRDTADAVVIELAVPDEFAAGFRSGQHLTVCAEVDGTPLYRTYSVCEPAFRKTMAIGVRILPGGRVSSYLAQCCAGQTLQVAPPSGLFYLHPLPAAGNALFIAGGSGITPVVSMLETLLHDSPDSTATLLYANRDFSKTMFLDRLMQLKNTFMTRLQMHFFTTRQQQAVAWRNARLNADTLALLQERNVLAPAEYDVAYLCGPLPMMDSCESFLREAGVADIHTEQFTAAEDATPAPAPSAKAENAAEAATLHVTFGGVQHEFPFHPDDASVLAAAKRSGINLPFACAGGVCGTCRAKVLGGEATMDKNYALEEEDLRNGFVLACQAKPSGDRLSLLFDY